MPHELVDTGFDPGVGGLPGERDLEGLTRPLLEALAKLTGFESTYLTVFHWDGREQEVRFVHSVGRVEIVEGSRLPLPEGVTRESLAGVTRSPAKLPTTHPDSQAARRLGLRTYVSVPVMLARHELFGMFCAASRRSQPVTEAAVSVMEFFAQIVADHTTRARVAATEQRADASEEQLRARARFLAIAEHQLKTPLTSILGAAQILRDGWEDLDRDERGQFLDMVIRGGVDLSIRVGGLLVEARADVRGRELAPVELDLVGFVPAIARTFDAVATDHDVRADVEEGLTTWADPVALHQVLGHLLDNAIKYSPSDGVVSVVARTTTSGVDIAVVDEGNGLPDGIDIFDAFQRGDDDEMGVAPGIGLGLHIVRSLVEAMGGSVDAKANADRGTTFTISLPER